METSVYKKFQNLRQGTILVFNIPVYRDGFLVLNKKQYEESKEEVERLIDQEFIVEVPLDTKKKPYIMERAPDILAQEDEPDEEGIFVQQKNAPLFSSKNPSPKKKEVVLEEIEDGVGESSEVKGEEVEKTAKTNDKKLKTSDKVVRDDADILPSDIDDRVVSLHDKEKIIEDGFEENQRKTSIVSDTQNWYDAVNVIKEISDITELEIIIKNDGRKAVVKAAKKRKEQLLTRD